MGSALFRRQIGQFGGVFGGDVEHDPAPADVGFPAERRPGLGDGGLGDGGLGDGGLGGGGLGVGGVGVGGLCDGGLGGIQCEHDLGLIGRFRRWVGGLDVQRGGGFL